MADTEYRGIEYLGADNPNLQQDPRTGRTFHLENPSNRPSVLGGGETLGGSRPRGIGGSEIIVESHPIEAQRAREAAGQTPATRQYTPDELMTIAKNLQQAFLSKAAAAERPHSSSVQSTLDRDSRDTSPTPPAWLTEYMSTQEAPRGPNMGTTQMGGPVDKVKAKQYLSEQEMRKHWKAQNC